MGSGALIAIFEPPRNQVPGRGFHLRARAEVYALEDDVQLMLAFRQGDVAAFDALFQRWAAPLLRYLERMVKDVATAEELVQESFLRVHRARSALVEKLGSEE